MSKKEIGYYIRPKTNFRNFISIRKYPHLYILSKCLLFSFSCSFDGWFLFCICSVSRFLSSLIGGRSKLSFDGSV